MPRGAKDNARLNATVIAWGEAEFGKSISQQIRALKCQPNDVLLVYLTGIGISHNQKAYIVCRESDLARHVDDAPAEGCLELTTLLKDVSKAAGPDVKKLVILDLGRLATDPRRGLLVNEFPELVEKEVQESAAKDLWVLNSTALFAFSIGACVRHSKQRSVFGQAVAEGLDGRADAGRGIGKAGDGSIRLFELYGYVLQQCAAQSRGEDSIPGQTPLLIRTGKNGGVLGPAAALLKQNGDDVTSIRFSSAASARSPRRRSQQPCRPMAAEPPAEVESGKAWPTDCGRVDFQDGLRTCFGSRLTNGWQHSTQVKRRAPQKKRRP